MTSIALKRTSLACALVALASMTGCTAPRTEVIVITNTDLSVPDELDQILIEVTGPDAEVQTASANLRTGLRPPRHLGLVHDGGRLGPFSVRVRGLLASAPVVERTAVFEFQPDRTLVLRVDLLEECVGVACTGETTCAAGGCRARTIAPEELEEFDGQLPDAGAPPGDDAGAPRDAGVPTDTGTPPPEDAGACVPETETCNEADDDCDGTVDEDFDLDTDTANCGSCGNDCGGDACTGGVCEGGGCGAGTADCDANPDDCETNTTNDVDNCGGCDVRCRGTTRLCCDGVCAAAC